MFHGCTLRGYCTLVAHYPADHPTVYHGVEVYEGDHEPEVAPVRLPNGKVYPMDTEGLVRIGRVWYTYTGYQPL